MSNNNYYKVMRNNLLLNNGIVAIVKAKVFVTKSFVLVYSYNTCKHNVLPCTKLVHENRIIKIFARQGKQMSDDNDIIVIIAVASQHRCITTLFVPTY